MKNTIFIVFFILFFIWVLSGFGLSIAFYFAKDLPWITWSIIVIDLLLLFLFILSFKNSKKWLF